MEFIRGQQNLHVVKNAAKKGHVVTIGNFDGVHLGHQDVLKQLCETANALQLPSLVITFEPQPREFFSPHDAPARLTSLREKLQQLQKTAIDRVLCLRFDANFASLPAQDFIDQILWQGLRTQYLIVGPDFRFGHQRQGDITMLETSGQQKGFVVTSLDKVNYAGEAISSTRVRDALKQGDLSLAQVLLGRPYTMSGRVSMGDQRGRTIGFPTLNIPLRRLVSPLHGVYAVKIYGYQGQVLYGVANIGSRPTVDGQKFLLEVHVFDFNQEIYGAHLEVEFVKKIRDEKKFASFALLREQIEQDAAVARGVFATK